MAAAKEVAAGFGRRFWRGLIAAATIFVALCALARPFIKAYQRGVFDGLGQAVSQISEDAKPRYEGPPQRMTLEELKRRGPGEVRYVEITDFEFHDWYVVLDPADDAATRGSGVLLILQEPERPDSVFYGGRGHGVFKNAIAVVRSYDIKTEADAKRFVENATTITGAAYPISALDMKARLELDRAKRLRMDAEWVIELNKRPPRDAEPLWASRYNPNSNATTGSGVGQAAPQVAGPPVFSGATTRAIAHGHVFQIPSEFERAEPDVRGAGAVRWELRDGGAGAESIEITRAPRPDRQSRPAFSPRGIELRSPGSFVFIGGQPDGYVTAGDVEFARVVQPGNAVNYVGYSGSVALIVKITTGTDSAVRRMQLEQVLASIRPVTDEELRAKAEAERLHAREKEQQAKAAFAAVSPDVTELPRWSPEARFSGELTRPAVAGGYAISVPADRGRVDAMLASEVMWRLQVADDRQPLTVYFSVHPRAQVQNPTGPVSPLPWPQVFTDKAEYERTDRLRSADDQFVGPGYSLARGVIGGVPFVRAAKPHASSESAPQSVLYLAYDGDGFIRLRCESRDREPLPELVESVIRSFHRASPTELEQGERDRAAYRAQHAERRAQDEADRSRQMELARQHAQAAVEAAMSPGPGAVIDTLPIDPTVEAQLGQSVMCIGYEVRPPSQLRTQRDQTDSPEVRWLKTDGDADVLMDFSVTARPARWTSRYPGIKIGAATDPPEALIGMSADELRYVQGNGIEWVGAVKYSDRGPARYTCIYAAFDGQAFLTAKLRGGSEAEYRLFIAMLLSVARVPEPTAPVEPAIATETVKPSESVSPEPDPAPPKAVAEVQATYIVMLHALREEPPIVRVILETTGLPPQDAAELVHSLPRAIKVCPTQDEANALAARLRAAGGEAEVVRAGAPRR